MGGVGPTGRTLTLASGCALCAECNTRAEGDLQSEALRHGWKVPRSCPVPDNLIPVFDALTGNWWSLDDDGDREWVPDWIAENMIDNALAA